MEGCLFVLRYFLNLSIKLGSRSLIDAAGVGKAGEAHGLKDAEHTGGIDVGCEFGRVKRYLDVALGGKIVDFVRAHF